MKTYRWLVYLFLAFMVTTLTYSLWPSNIISVNKIIGILIILDIVLIEVNKGVKRWDAFILLMTITSAFTSIFITLINFQDISQGIEDAIYWVVTILILALCNDQRFLSNLWNAIELNKNPIKCLTYTLNIFMAVCLLIPSCYRANWEGKYFVGFGFSEHAICSGACLLAVFNLFLLRKKSKCKLTDGIILVPSILVVLQAGARTFIVPIGIIAAIFYVYCVRNKSFKKLAFPIIILGAYYLFNKSNMLEKFITATNNIYTSSNRLVSFSNGRLDFWLIDIKEFISYPLINKIWGNGFDHVYFVNQQQYYGSYIWAHNDFITTILGAGIIGTVIYLVAMFKLYRYAKININSKFVIALITWYFVFVWFINGIFTLQHYLYSFVVLYTCICCDTRYQFHKK